MDERKTSEQDASTSGRAFESFPYRPYDIQQHFMEQLYDTLQAGGIGLFESPTGTGKTLSLICGTLKWLQDARAAEAASSAAERHTQARDHGLPDWMAISASTGKPEESKAKSARQKKSRAPLGKVSKQAPQAASGSEEQQHFLPDEWHSDTEAPSNKRRRGSGREHIVPFGSSSDGDSSDPETSDDEETFTQQQVIFCSRTHSQLSQFVGELKRTKLAEMFSLAALASRQTLCINDAVLRLGSAARITERCLDLQRPAKERASGQGEKGACPFMKVKASAKRNFKERILGEPMDVEELGRLGRRKAVCPYYMTRSAMPAADVVLLPYSGLLSQEAREALGVRLAGSVVIVDEAHNLVGAVNSAHSAVLTAAQLETARMQLAAYYQRFQARLAPGNSQNIQMLIYTTETLQQCLCSSSGHSNAQICSVNSFLFSAGLDNVNLFRLVRYAKESKVLFKVAGFADAILAKEGSSSVQIHSSIVEQGTAEDNETESLFAGSGTGALQALLAFFVGLNNRDMDGRIITDPSSKSLKFVLLNAAYHFSKVLEAAHAVILASGTLAPVASLCCQLFPGRPVRSFTCGHVIGQERLLALALGVGPSGETLDLRHPHRSSPASMDQLGRLLINICQAIPQGVVVFFPSFAYGEEVHSRWAATGLLTQLATRKRIFKEPRSSGQVEAVLRDYADCIASSDGVKGPGGRVQGAVLLCVVGGKMAEGINFGDGLGRCVVMVGMPYPNPADPELAERMRFLDSQASPHATVADGPTPQATSAGREYYEDLCMKAVNQCIGRVIRHRQDWAAVVLADARWASPAGAGSRQKLPAWIQKSLLVCSGFGDAYSRLQAFGRRMDAGTAQGQWAARDPGQ